MNCLNVFNYFLISNFRNFIGKLHIFLFNNLKSVLGNFGCVIMLRNILHFVWVEGAWLMILIDIDFGKLCCSSCFNIHEPVSSLPAVTTGCWLEYFTLWHFCHILIIVLSPLHLEIVIDECVVMPATSIAIVNAYRLQIINFLLHFFHSIGFIDLLFQFLNLLFHWFYLCTQLVIIGFKCVHRVQYISSFLDLILEWVERLDTQIFVIIFPLIRYMWFTILIL